MGRDVSVVSTHDESVKPVVRSIISAETKIDVTSEKVCFSLKPYKTFIFNKETEERIYIEEVK
jgi:multiple sugar transport system ATP-binding protein